MKCKKSSRLAPLILLFLIAHSALSTSCVFRAPFVPRDTRQLRGAGQIYLIPINQFPSSRLSELASHYRRKYGVQVEVKSNLQLPPPAYNFERKQLRAEEVVSVIRRRYQPAGDEPRLVLIGVTGDDMYIEGKSWNYAFSYRAEDGVAVVSSARMDHGFLGLRPASEEVQMSRLRKMITKNIGILYFHLPLSDDPRSVLYGNVGGPQELDRMGEDF